MVDSNRIFGSRREVTEFWLFVVFGILGPMGLSVVGLIRFPLADENSPLLLRVPLATLAIAGTALILFRRRLFSRRSRSRRVLLGIYVFGLAEAFAFTALGGFLILNGVLDRGARTETTYEIVFLAEPPHAYVRPLGKPEASSVRMDIQEPYWRSGPGAVLVVETGPGCFGERWVSGRRLVTSGDVGAGEMQRAPFSPRASARWERQWPTLSLLLVVLTVVWVADYRRRRSLRKRTRARS